MNPLAEKGIEILASRSVWEQKQRLFYQMRHDGIRRVNKPFPNAADAHFPLIDMHIGDLKPFWVAQAFGGERLSDFVAMKEQLLSMTEASADFFDFELRYRTAFRLQFERAVDTMLLRGRGILKAVVDPFEQYAIVIKSIDPQFILMSGNFDDFEEADSFVEVQKLTVAQYRRNRNYNQSSDVLACIRGRDNFSFESMELDKAIREGITNSSKPDEIMLWHHYEKTPGGWTVNTFSPMASDKEIRKPMGVPFKVDGKASLPFYSFTMEIKEDGWYAPRGIAELNAAFEMYATKLWNEKSDSMTYGNKPLFTGDNPMANSANIKFLPGEYIPGNVAAVQMPQPAYSFGEEINFTRQLSEQRSRMPDFGVSQDGEPGKPRTATENNRIASLQAVGADHNGDMFKSIRLLKFYRHVWGLIVQFKGRNLSYYAAENLKTVPEQALHDQYLTLPAGGSANKQQKLQRASNRFMALKGAPNIDQDGLAKDLLAADDARLIPKLLIPMNQKAQSEAFQEDLELGVMEKGRPVPVMPGQDHATRVMEILGFFHKQQVTGAPVDPMAKQVIMQHLGQHMQALKQSDPQAFKQISMQVQQMEAAAMQQQPANVAQLPQGQPPEQPQPEQGMM